MEEKGLGGHDRLYAAVCELLSGIDDIGKLKRHGDHHAGEQASRLKEAVMLRKQVEELEAKVSMLERRLMEMLCISEDRHDRTKRELAHLREKADVADRRIENLEAAVSRYQSRIAVAEAEKEKAEERARRASIKGETTSTPRRSPIGAPYRPMAPGSTSMSFVPSPGASLADLEVCEKALFFLN